MTALTKMRGEEAKSGSLRRFHINVHPVVFETGWLGILPVARIPKEGKVLWARSARLPSIFYANWR